MRLKEMNLTINAFLGLADRFGIFLFQASVLGTFRFLVFRVHINDAKDAVVAIFNTFFNLFLQLFHT